MKMDYQEFRSTWKVVAQKIFDEYLETASDKQISDIEEYCLNKSCPALLHYPETLRHDLLIEDKTCCHSFLGEVVIC